MFNKVKMKSLIMSTNNLDGFYNGVVADREDPRELSRVKVSIFNCTEGIPVADLPWYSLSNAISASPNSKASIPPQGSEVVVEFPTGDIYNGVVKYMVVSKPPS